MTPPGSPAHGPGPTSNPWFRGREAATSRRTCGCGACSRCKNRAAQALSIARYPERRRARNAVTHALRSGELERGPCVRAGADCEGRIEAHHVDYARPLLVEWACAHHHVELDRECGRRVDRSSWRLRSTRFTSAGTSTTTFVPTVIRGTPDPTLRRR
jgi:hypothetical protein